MRKVMQSKRGTTLRFTAASALYVTVRNMGLICGIMSK